MSSHADFLAQSGWRAFFSQQLTLQDLQDARPARVSAIHRSALKVLTEDGEFQATLTQRPRPDESGAHVAVAVGDWVLVSHQTQQVVRILDRQSLISRMAAGNVPFTQPIAANIDTLFVVTSCNDDFNPSRIERYLTLAHDAQVTPVIVLTKVDLCPEADPFVAAAQSCSATGVAVETVNATNQTLCFESLRPWLGQGQTVAFVGSSGVGKSTLINSLLGSALQETQEIRESDAKGRHTTTTRNLFQAPCGAWLIDTPGMRELKMGAVPAAVRQTFVDIESLSKLCHFRDCHHQNEPGCAVLGAIAQGQLEPRRLENFRKLTREAQRVAMPVWELRQASKSFGQMGRAAQKRRKKERWGEPD
jgi:ribosome biogenesis GTPase / thiamine phosphate phosphatase